MFLKFLTYPIRFLWCVLNQRWTLHLSEFSGGRIFGFWSYRSAKSAYERNKGAYWCVELRDEWTDKTIEYQSNHRDEVFNYKPTWLKESGPCS